MKGGITYLRSVHGLKGRRVLVRIDANVPSGARGVGDPYRLERVLPTLSYLSKEGARIVVISHREEKEKRLSLAPVADYFARTLPVKFFPGDSSKARGYTVPPGEILVLENLRNDPREEQNDLGFARELSQLAELFVLDAFGAMHRRHASIVGVPRCMPSVGGFLLEEELTNLGKVLECRDRCVVVIGGLKFATKAPLIKRFLETADRLFVVGALANSFYKAQGLEIGTSAVDPDYASVIPFLNHKKIVLPQDVVVDRGGESYVVPASGVLAGEKIVDAGPSLVETMSEAVRGAGTVLWNGPLGMYESGFAAGTEKFARALAVAPGFRVIGGGDTISAVSAAGLLAQFDFASTGGGAMLDYLAEGTLPGIKALEESADFLGSGR